MSINNYIFLTEEGSTYQPCLDSLFADIDNLQVIGFSSGKDQEDAFRNLLNENKYLASTGFDNVFCYKLDDGYENSRKDFKISEFV